MKINSAIASILIAVMLMTGCGGVSSVQASSTTPPTIGPEVPLTCGPVTGGDNCHWVHHIKDANGKELGYCQGDVYMWPHSMSFTLEIGLVALIDDPTLSGCPIFVPHVGTIVNLRGNVGLEPWTNNATSIVTWLYAIDNGQKEILHMSKMQASHSVPIAIPFEGASGQPLVFNSGYHFDALLLWFNNDLAGSVPATISVAGAGDIL
jgi:hypothetical protein